MRPPQSWWHWTHDQLGRLSSGVQAALQNRMWRAMLLICIYAAAHYLYVYWTHPYSPLWRSGIDHGWFAWPDQFSNLYIAEHLANFQRPAPLHYGIGYGLLAVPFLWLQFSDPFLPLNLLLYVGTMAIYLRLACLFLSPELSIVALVVLSHEAQFLDFFVEPWSNVITVFCLGLFLLFLVARPRSNLLTVAIMGVCGSITLAARYGDVLLLLPVALVVLFAIAPTWKERISLSLVAALAALPVVLLVGWMHYDAFGSPLISPYVQHQSSYTGANNQEAGSRSLTYLGNHMFSMLFHAHLLDINNRFPSSLHWIAHRPLLGYYFVAILSGIGLAFAARKQRLLVLAFGLSLLAALLYYGTYWASRPFELRNHALRFLAAWEPLLVIGGIIGLVSLLHANWRAYADRRAVLTGLAITLGLIGGLYGLGRWLPPFPDWAQMVPTKGWNASASIDGGNANSVLDRTVNRGWYAAGVQPAGESFTIDMNDIYRLEEIFLLQSENNPTRPVSVSVELALDAQDWQTPDDLQIDTSRENAIQFRFAPTNARYMRFSLQEETTADGWAIDEIYAYGTRPLLAARPDGGWYDEEQAPTGEVYRWVSARSSIEVLSADDTMALLSFTVYSAAHAESTLDIIDSERRETLATIRVAPGRRVMVGPLHVAEGISELIFRVREGDVSAALLDNTQDDRNVSLAISRLRLLPLDEEANSVAR
jgi:hypothetical protein